MECIATLSNELFGKRFVEKTKTCKKGAKKNVYNYKTNKALLSIAINLMNWTHGQGGIDDEFARLYGPLPSFRPTT